MLVIYVQNSKCNDNDKSDLNTNSVFLSLSPSSKTPRTYQIDDKKISIDEPDNRQCTTKRTNNCFKSKVRNIAENKECSSRVAIQVSENGIIKVISDKETML